MADITDENLIGGLKLNEKEFSTLYLEFFKAINGRHSMTAKELIEIDDFCTTLVVDPLVRFRSHKMIIDYQPPDMKTFLLCQSIMMQFIYDEDLLKVYKGFYSLSITHKFLKSRTEKAKDHLRDHLLRFIAMFRHDAGYTVAPCQRYAHEGNVGAKLIATKFWHKGERMDQLIGVIGNLTAEEEAELLVPGVNDFSVLHSTRKNRAQLWLGPGAFLNHDCNPNCEFVSNRNSTATINVIRDIAPGEELFIFYGPEFFGTNNELCECQTCEKRELGHFLKTGGPHPDRRARPPSPTASMASYKIEDDGTIVRRKATRFQKPAINPQELLHDSKKFFQDHILEVFINRPIITQGGLENFPTLDRMRFNPKGLPKIQDKQPHAIARMLAGDHNDETFYAIEQHFPKPIDENQEITVTNLLAFLGMKIGVLQQVKTKDGDIIDKKLVIGANRSWVAHNRKTEIASPVKMIPATKPRKIEKLVSQSFIDELLDEAVEECCKFGVKERKTQEAERTMELSEVTANQNQVIDVEEQTIPFLAGVTSAKSVQSEMEAQPTVPKSAKIEAILIQSNIVKTYIANSMPNPSSVEPQIASQLTKKDASVTQEIKIASKEKSKTTKVRETQKEDSTQKAEETCQVISNNIEREPLSASPTNIPPPHLSTVRNESQRRGKRKPKAAAVSSEESQSSPENIVITSSREAQNVNNKIPKFPPVKKKRDTRK